MFAVEKTELRAAGRAVSYQASNAIRFRQQIQPVDIAGDRPSAELPTMSPASVIGSTASSDSPSPSANRRKHIDRAFAIVTETKTRAFDES